MLALVLLGLIAHMLYVAQIGRWAKRHWHGLKGLIKFKRKKPAVEIITPPEGFVAKEW
jgi:hypothetical protein